jgi:ABC-type sulfate transport system permease component
MFFFCFTLYLIFKSGFKNFIKYLTNPEVALCLVFTLVLGFAVGLTAFNFGALVRFKIPLLPFYLVGLLIIYDLSTKDKKLKAEKAQALREARAKVLAERESKVV